MNYYIDFDNTLYNTPLLVQKMIQSISDNICSIKSFEHDELNSINDIYNFIDFLEETYSVDKSKILDNLNKIILNGSNFVFPDSEQFLKNICKNNNVFLLSYANNTLSYQTSKILGSNLLKYFDGIYITCKPKYELDIDYTNGIFIDDNPKDLSGLYSKNPKKLIRLRRKQNKYSSIDLNFNIEEYENFDEINI